MLKKNASYVILSLLLVNSLTYAFNIQAAIASETIYIRADGNVDPPTAPIQRSLDVYTFTDDITGSVVIEKDSIVVNGEDHTLQGTGSEIGIYLSQRTNVTIQDMKIKTFDNAFYLLSSNHVTIFATTISDSSAAIWLSDSSNNSISENNITANVLEGIYLLSSSNNSISRNNITANTFDGIYLSSSSNNSIFENNIINNGLGVTSYYSTDNKIFHNNFINNTEQAYSESSTDIWDDDYPSGGNYWSNYANGDEKRGSDQSLPGSDGIGDIPHIIDEDNIDHYPLVKLFAGPHDIGIRTISTSKTVVGQGYSLTINIKVTNYGVSTETFNVTTYANTIIINTSVNVITSRNSTTISFAWNTTGFAKGNYTISAYAEPVLGETDIADNTLPDGWIIVTIPGDCAGPEPMAPPWCDGKVFWQDLLIELVGYGATPTDPRWTNYNLPRADFNSDNQIFWQDLLTVLVTYGTIDP